MPTERLLGPQPDGSQRLFDDAVGFGFGRCEVVTPDRCPQDVIDLVERVVGLEGILEDDLDFASELGVLSP